VHGETIWEKEVTPMHTHSEPACLSASLVAGLRAPGDILRKAKQASRLGGSCGIGQPRTPPAKAHDRGAPASRRHRVQSALSAGGGLERDRTLASGFTVIATFPVFCPVSTYL
jgi:hypothetical protein